MKKTLFLLATITSIFISCNKSKTDSSSNSSLPSSPETKPQYDNTSFGVYKGIIVGSSGYIIFRINNGDNIVKGYLVIDNQKDTLTTTANITLGQSLINVPFVGKISSMNVSANSDGSNASLSNIRINGHNNVTGFIIHEASTKQIMCYEGTFTGTQSGIINVTRAGLTVNDTTYFLAKVQNNIDDTLYFGKGGCDHYSDTVRASLFGINYYRAQFEPVVGFYNDNTKTFSGTWKSQVYGNGEFVTHRTY